MTGLTVRWHDEQLAVGLVPSSAAPVELGEAPIRARLSTAEGDTIVFAYRATIDVETRTGADLHIEGPFRALEVQGPLDFSLTGILASLLAPLAEAEISVFTLSTFDTDWVLVPAALTGAATSALTAAGHTVSAGAEYEESQ
ncbi:hypothetical protein FHX42_003417 [Saccharopolyspora lacisalsi]|uniref:CASTOR ACT domain-containing protein n=1 Tax=Halosaccharopolyspora lacisalsi TaxID=1000566 RepID=A0A839E3V3_9PSEU|nr:ACT domain-containing protein [Halosaccharopolyspora lacisalsi]MBA8826051.1 hypothetical protein [Halosaccharopolyspora lacisalsi]